MIKYSSFKCVFLVVRPFVGAKFKVICKGQGQISGSHVGKKEVIDMTEGIN